MSRYQDVGGEICPTVGQVLHPIPKLRPIPSWRRDKPKGVNTGVTFPEEDSGFVTSHRARSAAQASPLPRASLRALPRTAPLQVAHASRH